MRGVGAHRAGHPDARDVRIGVIATAIEERVPAQDWGLGVTGLHHRLPKSRAGIGVAAEEDEPRWRERIVERRQQHHRVASRIERHTDGPPAELLECVLEGVGDDSPGIRVVDDEG